MYYFLSILNLFVECCWYLIKLFWYYFHFYYLFIAGWTFIFTRGFLRSQRGKRNLKRILHEIEQKNAKAQYELASLYMNGEVVKHSYEHSAYWMEKAAMEGVAQAQFQIGRFYQWEFGVKHNNVLAEHWLRRAASQGHGWAYDKANGFNIAREKAAIKLQERRMAGEEVEEKKIVIKPPSKKELLAHMLTPEAIKIREEKRLKK